MIVALFRSNFMYTKGYSLDKLDFLLAGKINIHNYLSSLYTGPKKCLHIHTNTYKNEFRVTTLSYSVMNDELIVRDVHELLDGVKCSTTKPSPTMAHLGLSQYTFIFMSIPIPFT